MMIEKELFLRKSWNPFGFKVFFFLFFAAKISDVHDDANGEAREGAGKKKYVEMKSYFLLKGERLGKALEKSTRQMLNHASKSWQMAPKIFF